MLSYLLLDFFVNLVCSLLFDHLLFPVTFLLLFALLLLFDSLFFLFSPLLRLFPPLILPLVGIIPRLAYMTYQHFPELKVFLIIYPSLTATTSLHLQNIYFLLHHFKSKLLLFPFVLKLATIAFLQLQFVLFLDSYCLQSYFLESYFL